MLKLVLRPIWTAVDISYYFNRKLILEGFVINFKARQVILFESYLEVSYRVKGPLSRPFFRVRVCR